MKIFVSHAANAIRIAVRFKELIRSANQQAEVFLSSDWESIRSGEVWLQKIESALKECDYFVALITKEEDAKLLWINFEIGYIRGRGLLPKIIVFSGIDPRRIEYPISGIHLLMHGDTNRWMLEFSEIGMKITDQIQAQFAALFEHR